MKLFFGTTAALLLAAAPAFAQVSPYDTNPTPQERQQTDRLNQSAADDASAPVAPSSSEADYAAKKAEYDRRMREYDARRDVYEHERDRYRADRAGYAHRWDAFYGYRGFRDVDTMSGGTLVACASAPAAAAASGTSATSIAWRTAPIRASEVPSGKPKRRGPVVAGPFCCAERGRCAGVNIAYRRATK